MFQEDIISNTLRHISESIDSGHFLDVETELVELKDLSTGDNWKSLKETICAFLNTKGGYIICGVRERYKSYTITGFERNNEPKLVTEISSKSFISDKDLPVDVNANITFRYENLKGYTIAIIEVSPLSEDLKYIKFNGYFFERVLTRDQKIPESKLNQHKEYKTELEYSKEITAVKNASIEDLDLEKINQFILRINYSSKKETIKKDLEDAVEFLKRRYCIDAVTNEITTLGLLLFGKDPFQKLQYRAEIDCYFETGDTISRDKLYLQDDVLNLIDGAFKFVWGHIKIGRTYSGGGRSEPEYPEKLIRETINNAIAHRDYTIDKFITLKINPGESFEIRNPGSFKEKMLVIFDDLEKNLKIRRLIPGLPETKNPKLANILKAFDKIESQGIGMATLVTECLDNKINVPYYELSIDSVSLVIPSGKLLDDETLFWLESYNNYINEKLGEIVSDDHKVVLAYLYKSEILNRKDFYTILLSRNNNHLDVIQDLEACNLIYKVGLENNIRTTIYFLNRDLVKVDFSDDIKALFEKVELNSHPQIKIFNQKWEEIDKTVKIVLNIIYRYSKYNLRSIKPSEITPEVYRKLHGNQIIPTTYESLGRKVRKICGDLEKTGLLEKPDGKGYIFK